jgi:hypothetical protein
MKRKRTGTRSFGTVTTTTDRMRNMESGEFENSFFDFWNWQSDNYLLLTLTINWNVPIVLNTVVVITLRTIFQKVQKVLQQKDNRLNFLCRAATFAKLYNFQQDRGIVV